MSKNIVRKTVASVAAVAALSTALVACSNSEGDSTSSSASASASADAKDAQEGTGAGDSDEQTPASEIERVGKNASKDKDDSLKSDDKDVTKAVEAAESYVNYIVSTPIEGDAERVVTEVQDKAVEIAGEEVFNSPDPRSAMNNLDNSKKKQLIELTEKQSDISDVTNYDKISDGDKILANIVSLLFRSIVATEASDGVAYHAEIDENKVKKSEDKVEIPPEAIIIKSQAGEEIPGAFSMPLTVAKDGRNWKVDAGQVVNSMLTPTEVDTTTGEAEGAEDAQ